MLKKIILIISFSFLNFHVHAFEPYSGISCHSDGVKGKEEYLFKHDENHIYATAYKRLNGEFIKIGDVIGQKVSSFLLFEDMTVDKNLNFAWHLDMVTKNLKPFVLTVDKKNKIKMPPIYDCISKNFWF
jgi:hypothetical protein